MKKILAILLSFVLLLCYSQFAVAEEHEGIILNFLDKSASEWAKSNESRTFFAACAALDLMLATNIEAESDKIATIVAYAADDDAIVFIRDSNIVAIVFCGESQCLMIAYQPSINKFGESYIDVDSSYSASLKKMIIEQAINENGGTFYEINSSDFYDALDAIQAVFSD